MIYNAYAEQNEELLGVTAVSCGHIFAKPGREIKRPSGREDWLLFYIAKENETFFLDKTETAEPGSFILFAPGEKQHHIYLGNKTAEFYYIHFRCAALPAPTLQTSKIYHAPFCRQACDIFEEILDETMRKRPFYERLVLGKFFCLLTLLEREVAAVSRPDVENFERIALAVRHMNKNYQAAATLADYAAMCGLSKYHFLRVFEKIIGVSPMEYRNAIRLQHAAEYLSDDALSVEKVAERVGFSSASYFSSAFKQKYGVSPKRYQSKR